MAITFPRDFLDPLPFRAATFEQLYFNAQSPTRGALQQVAELAPALWQIKFETYPMREADAEAWKAWLASLRGGQRAFKAWNPVREYALAYPGGYDALTRHGGGSFAAGTATLTTIGAGRDTVTLSTLPSTFALTAGDMISIPFASGAKRCLVRVTEGAAAVAGVATVAVEPVLPPAVATGVSVDLKRPHCLAILDPASVSGPWQLGRRAPIMFAAVSGY
jgi:hypothetical protein